MITKEMMTQELRDTMEYDGITREQAIEIMLLVHDNDTQSSKCRTIARQALKGDGIDTFYYIVDKLRLSAQEEKQAYKMYHASYYTDIKKWTEKELDTLRAL